MDVETSASASLDAAAARLPGPDGRCPPLKPMPAASPSPASTRYSKPAGFPGRSMMVPVIVMDA